MKRTSANEHTGQKSYRHLFWLLLLGAWAEALARQGQSREAEEVRKGQCLPQVWNISAQGNSLLEAGRKDKLSLSKFLFVLQPPGSRELV